MREILFRGKRVDNGEWVQGFVSQNTIVGEKCCVKLVIHTPTDIPFDGKCYEVDENSTSEFTGLCDKNGKKVFEGDIVRNEYKTNKYQYFLVKWDNKSFSWIVENEYGWAGKLGNIIGLTEIIGNIHDNPELLKRHENS